MWSSTLKRQLPAVQMRVLACKGTSLQRRLQIRLAYSYSALPEQSGVGMGDSMRTHAWAQAACAWAHLALFFLSQTSTCMSLEQPLTEGFSKVLTEVKKIESKSQHV